MNSFHDSYTGLGGMITMFNMMLGEVAPGGVGSGLYGMLVLAVITVFVAGLMVGRTPEYLGKKIGAREIKLAVAVHPDHPAAGAGRHRASRWRCRASGRAMLNTGPHGFSEVLYAFTSAANNNGSAFAGLTRQHAVVQHHARPGHAARPVPADHLRAGPGRLAGRAEPTPGAAGTLPTHRPLFVGMVVGVDADPGRPDLPPRARARARSPKDSTDDHPSNRLRAGHRTPTPERRKTRRRRPARPQACCCKSLPDALRKLDPRTLWRNPVMFIVEIGAVFTTVLAVTDPSLVRLG